MPENPEIDYGYMWGKPQIIGNKVNLTVMQSLDFPTVYINRSRLAKSASGIAGHYYRGIRQESLLLAKQSWIKHVHLNKQIRLIRQRMVETENVLDYLNSRYKSGEISKLALNRALLLNASLSAMLDETLAKLAMLKAEITYLAGNNDIPVKDSIYNTTTDPGIDSILQISLDDPVYQAYHEQVERSSLRENLARAEGMPRIRTGYISETFPGESLRGVQVGVSVPLWENANRVKLAKGETLSAEMELERFRSSQESRIRQTYERMVSYRRQMDRLHEALDITNDPQLLEVTMESGEISMLEYYDGTALFYQVQEEFLEAEREFHITEAELSKYEL